MVWWTVLTAGLTVGGRGHAGNGNGWTDSCRDDAVPPSQIEGDAKEAKVDGVARQRVGAHAAHAVAALHGAEQPFDVAPHRDQRMVAVNGGLIERPESAASPHEAIPQA